MTLFTLAVAVLLWEAGYDTVDIAFALDLDEAEIWNVLTPIREGVPVDGFRQDDSAVQP